jgi:muramoyltetrapeptide carboxypeptidase
MSGVLVGGCLEVVSPMAGTPYAEVPEFGRAHSDEGLIVYLEACEHGAYDVARALHGLRLAGWFDHASGVLIGRTPAPDSEKMTQHEAVADALGMLDVPVVLDADIGHTQPFLPLVNGAPARVVVTDERCEVTQVLA